MKVPEIQVLLRIPLPGTKNGLPIFWYGVMLLVGFLTGMWVARRLARREGVPPETIYDLALWAIVSGLIGARLWFVIENAGRFYSGPDAEEGFFANIGRTLNVSDGGLVFYGGIVLPAIVLTWWFRRRRLSGLKMFDILAVPVMLGLSFGRIGCLFNGCCFGKVCGEGFPLGIIRPAGGPTWAFQRARGLIGVNAQWSLPVHPTQLYEWAGTLAICGLLLLLYRAKKRDGDILAWLLILYPVLRTLVELGREHEAEALVGGAAISVAQIFSAGAFISGVVMLILRSKRPIAQVAAPPEPAPPPREKTTPKRAKPASSPPAKRRRPPRRKR